ncbi:MAG: sensor histidine kinase [Enterocloster sp.]
MKHKLKQIPGKLRKRYADSSLRYKLIAIALFNSITITICALFGYRLYTSAYEHLLFKATAGNLSLTSYKISEQLENMESLSSLVISSSVIQASLSRLMDSDDVLVRSENHKILNSALQDYYTSFRLNGIAYLALYNSQFTNCTNWALLNKTNPELLSAARENGIRRQGAVTWTYYSRNDYMCLSRDVRRIKNMSLDSIGELVIGVDMNAVVTEATRSLSMYQDLNFILTDSQNRLIYASDSLSDEDAMFFLSRMQDPYETISYNGHDYFAVWGTLPNYQYKYITLAPFDEISDSLRLSLRITALFFIAGFALILFLSNWLIRVIMKQFNALIDKMEAFTNNELVLPDEEDRYSSQKDEIGTLHRQFNLMARRIQNLIQVNYVNEILTKEAQLKALKSQINPHFLYNTLETINWRAKAVGNDTISLMAESLGTLLRASLSNKKSLVTLSYELELAKSYMTIQKIRFEDRLAYETDIDASLLSGSIPPLTIQPLVENAIHYGMEEMTEVCHIYVDARPKEGLMCITVRNEGSYFEDNLLEKLRTEEKAPNGFGIGLLNIDQRIRLLFGDSYGLTLSNENGFATASIILPFQTEE